MKNIRNFIVAILLMLVFSFACDVDLMQGAVFALDEGDNYYTIYKEDGKKLFTTASEVENGDSYISGDNKMYKVAEVDKNKKAGKAKFIEDVLLPKINNNVTAIMVASYPNKTVGIYHTHNDESYVPTDGVESVYGAGGIHDIGKALASGFETQGVTAIVNDTLHIPHDSGAYRRSQKTASKLMRENSLNALLDVHRDGTSRAEYITTVDGEEMSKVRMVVGRSNISHEVNKEFALAIKALADNWYPGLIKDIFIGGGGYNQDQMGRAMLFEMGCHLIEKDLVIKSTKPLADVVDGVLFTDAVAAADGINSYGINNINAISTSSPAANQTITVIGFVLGGIVLGLFTFALVNKKARKKVLSFVSESTLGIFGKRNKNKTKKK